MPSLVLATAAAVAAVLFAVPRTEPSVAGPPVETVGAVHAFPHDTEAFCQGLVVYDGQLLEGTGQYQKSRLRLVDIESGVPTAEVPLNADVFGEGVTVWKDRILQLTWRNGYLIEYDAETMRPLRNVRYRDIDSRLREGWGITHDGSRLIISDGTSELRFVDPETMQLVRSVRVRSGFRALDRLNELEFVNGEILANVWYLDRIARINPENGDVIGWLDLSRLRPREVRNNREAVLNGIAWDADSGRLFVTGKNWPAVYQIAWPDPP